MRLTLRTLLAHEHGLLNEQQAELISQKIEQSPFVAQLLRHLKDRSARREIVPLAIEARGTVSLEKVTRYLDYALPAVEVVKLENECFASDRLLAEVASCHEIISQWLSTPTPIEPTLRQRLYAIMPGELEPSLAPTDELAIDLPALAYAPASTAAEIPEKELADEPVAAKTGWMGGAFRLFALAASVLILVTYITMNRAKVEAMIAQHWQGKAEIASQTTDAPAVLSPSVAPEMLASQHESMTPIETSGPGAVVPAPLPQVATTAFHMPVPVREVQQDANAWHIESSQTTLHQATPEAAWHLPASTSLSTGRVVVGPGGRCQLNRNGVQLSIQPISELCWREEEMATLRYGSLLVAIESGQELTLEVAGQRVKVVPVSESAQLMLSTKAVVDRGIDFASATANQEVQFSGISGEAELTIPGCRGPIPLEHGQQVISHLNHGVRGGEAHRSIKPESESPGSTLAEVIQNSSDPIRDVRNALSTSERHEAAILLAQLGQAVAWTEVWGHVEDPRLPSGHLEKVQQLFAQDAELARDVKDALSHKNPEHGPLVYRLICGFSDDQLSDETRLQLDALLRHPDPAVRAWTHFHLTQRENR